MTAMMGQVLVGFWWQQAHGGPRISEQATDSAQRIRLGTSANPDCDGCLLQVRHPASGTPYSIRPFLTWESPSSVPHTSTSTSMRRATTIETPSTPSDTEISYPVRVLRTGCSILGTLRSPTGDAPSNYGWPIPFISSRRRGVSTVRWPSPMRNSRSPKSAADVQGSEALYLLH